MKIDLLYFVVQYGDSWEEAFRHIEHKKWSDWALKRYGQEKPKPSDGIKFIHIDLSFPLPEDNGSSK